MRPGIQRPNSIFAARAGGKSKRPLYTVTPLSKLIGIEIDSSFLHTEVTALAKVVTNTPGVILVSWEHGVIREFIEALTGDAVGIRDWPDYGFDMVLVLDRRGEWGVLSQVPQKLLAGDRDAPF
jgi:hypothetical protein